MSDVRTHEPVLGPVHCAWCNTEIEAFLDEDTNEKFGRCPADDCGAEITVSELHVAYETRKEPKPDPIIAADVKPRRSKARKAARR